MPRNLPYVKSGVEKARRLRKEMTPAERKLWYEFLSKHPKRWLKQRPIGPYIADFYCASTKLVIEVDGQSHFTEEGISYDIERTAHLEGIGIRVLRFSNAEVIGNFEGVCLEIEHQLESSRAS